MDIPNVNQLPSASTLTHEEIASLLPHLDEMASWIKSIQEYALSEALAGNRFDGYKVVEGRSIRKWEDPDKAVEALIGAGLAEPLCYKPREVISPSDAERAVGKRIFAESLSAIVSKAQGKPTLVPSSDKRPEFVPQGTAEDDFAGLINK